MHNLYSVYTVDIVVVLVAKVTVWCWDMLQICETYGCGACWRAPPIVIAPEPLYWWSFRSMNKVFLLPQIQRSFRPQRIAHTQFRILFTKCHWKLHSSVNQLPIAQTMAIFVQCVVGIDTEWHCHRHKCLLLCGHFLTIMISNSHTSRRYRLMKFGCVCVFLCFRNNKYSKFKQFISIGNDLKRFGQTHTHIKLYESWSMIFHYKSYHIKHLWLLIQINFFWSDTYVYVHISSMLFAVLA